MTESDELYAESDRVVRELGRSKAPLSEAALPNSPGIYALWATAESSLGGLGLEDVPGEETLMTRPLYVGKDTSSLRKRLDKHFKPGDTGHSTVRRTLGSLKDMESLPRKTRNERPTEDQVKRLIRNFDLTEQNDEDLSIWMEDSLEVTGSASNYPLLGDLERAVAKVLRPPLDQERKPMWGPNPWRPQVADARRNLRVKARLAAEALYPDVLSAGPG